MEENANDLRAEVDDAGWVDKIKTDYIKANLTDVDRALCEHAIKLTRTPSGVAKADLDRLRTLGLSDHAISDATQVIAYFNYINRIADGLGVDPEPEHANASRGMVKS